MKEDKRRVYLEQQKEERRRERLEDVRQGQLRLEQQRYGTITKPSLSDVDCPTIDFKMRNFFWDHFEFLG